MRLNQKDSVIRFSSPSLKGERRIRFGVTGAAHLCSALPREPGGPTAFPRGPGVSFHSPPCLCSSASAPLLTATPRSRTRFDPRLLLHGEQYLEICAPLPPRAKVSSVPSHATCHVLSTECCSHSESRVELASCGSSGPKQKPRFRPRGQRYKSTRTTPAMNAVRGHHPNPSLPSQAKQLYSRSRRCPRMQTLAQCCASTGVLPWLPAVICTAGRQCLPCGLHSVRLDWVGHS